MHFSEMAILLTCGVKGIILFDIGGSFEYMKVMLLCKIIVIYLSPSNLNDGQ